MYFDVYYLILVIPAFLFSLYAQWKVNSAFSTYSRILNSRGITGAQAARTILDANGLQHVRVERVQGNLTDHFDPKSNVIRLSDATFAKSSVAAVGVAAHEAGHAVQYAEEYGPIRLRAAIIPVTQFGANLSWPAILIGVVMGLDFLVTLGILLFSFSTIFQLVTLPVEFNASRRAMEVMEGYGVLAGDELVFARRVLSAAAMTYVAALAVSLANLLRLILVFGRRDRR